MPNDQMTVQVGATLLLRSPGADVEPVSCPIMTLSAARSVLEAIFWEPQGAIGVVEPRTQQPTKCHSSSLVSTGTTDP